MHYLDPTRQRIGTLPMYYWLAHPVAAIPALSVRPSTQGQCEITLWLKVTPEYAKAHHRTLSYLELGSFAKGFEQNPELTLTNEFGWEYNPVKRIEVPRRLTLEELGL